MGFRLAPSLPDKGRFAVAWGTACALLAAAVPAQGALPPSLPDNPAGKPIGGDVLAIARSGGITYLGGSFTAVVTHTGRYAVVNGADGKAVPPFPEATGGNVTSSAPDGGGGWYIGGSFTSVGGVPRSGIAHVLADGTVDPTFDPDAGGGSVDAMALVGSELYVGGTFNEIGGLPRNGIAKLSATSGNAFSGWDPSATGDGSFSPEVNAIVVSGSEVFVGGRFANIGGLARTNVAKLSATSGNAFSAWDPVVTGVRVTSVAVSGSEVYVGGQITHVDGTVRNNIAKLSATGGNLFTTWDPDAETSVQAIAVSGSEVYVGGQFSGPDSIGGQDRDKIAKLSATSGNAFSGWNPGADNTILDIAISGDQVFLGGPFLSVGCGSECAPTPPPGVGKRRSKLAKVSAASGAVFESFDPRASVSGAVSTISLSGGNVLAGGSISSVNQIQRRKLAALDSNGMPTGWNPNVGPNTSGVSVNALAVASGIVYAGGSFAAVGGQPRTNVARLSAATGGVSSTWNPSADNPVHALAVSGTDVYAGGEFANIGGQPRNRIAKLDAAGSAVFGWNPNANGVVRALALSGSDLYVGGDFGGADSIAGEDRERVAKLNAATGNAITGWAPVVGGTSPSVRALTLSAGNVYLGGSFDTVDGIGRTDLAKVSASSGVVNASWAPNPNGNRVSALALSGSVLYTGGVFSTIGGLPRDNLAALSTSSAKAFRGFDPGPDGEVFGLVADNSGLYAGGTWNDLDASPRQSYAQFTGP